MRIRIKCTKCGYPDVYEWTNEGQSKGGKKKVPKGFAVNKDAQKKAQLTRSRNLRQCKKNTDK